MGVIESLAQESFSNSFRNEETSDVNEIAGESPGHTH